MLPTSRRRRTRTGSVLYVAVLAFAHALAQIMLQYNNAASVPTVQQSALTQRFLFSTPSDAYVQLQVNIVQSESDARCARALQVYVQQGSDPTVDATTGAAANYIATDTNSAQQGLLVRYVTLAPGDFDALSGGTFKAIVALFDAQAPASTPTCKYTAVLTSSAQYACLSDCNGAGVCRQDARVCACSANYFDVDCSKYADATLSPGNALWQGTLPAGTSRMLYFLLGVADGTNAQVVPESVRGVAKRVKVAVRKNAVCSASLYVAWPGGQGAKTAQVPTPDSYAQKYDMSASQQDQVIFVPIADAYGTLATTSAYVMPVLGVVNLDVASATPLRVQMCLVAQSDATCLDASDGGGAGSGVTATGSATAQATPLGALVGYIIAGIAGGGIVIGIVVYLLCRRRRSRGSRVSHSSAHLADTSVMPIGGGGGGGNGGAHNAHDSGLFAESSENTASVGARRLYAARSKKKKQRGAKVLSPEVVNAYMPAQTFAEVVAEGSLDEAEAQRECSVCLDAFTDKQMVRVTICGHIFHSDCLVGWLKKQETCPNCRHGLTRADLKNWRKTTLSHIEQLLLKSRMREEKDTFSSPGKDTSLRGAGIGTGIGTGAAASMVAASGSVSPQRLDEHRLINLSIRAHTKDAPPSQNARTPTSRVFATKKNSNADNESPGTRKFVRREPEGKPQQRDATNAAEMSFSREQGSDEGEGGGVPVARGGQANERRHAHHSRHNTDILRATVRDAHNGLRVERYDATRSGSGDGARPRRMQESHSGGLAVGAAAAAAVSNDADGEGKRSSPSSKVQRKKAHRSNTVQNNAHIFMRNNYAHEESGGGGGGGNTNAVARRELLAVPRQARQLVDFDDGEENLE